MKKKAFLLLVATFAGFSAVAHESGRGPLASSAGLLPARAVSVPCETENLAFDIQQFRKPKSASRWILPLDGTWVAGSNGVYTTTFTRPWRWRLRRTTLHLTGIDSACDVCVNGRTVGSADDCRTPVEFDLSPHLRVFGRNLLEIRVRRNSAGDFREAYLVSEHPKAPFDLVVETKLADDLTSGKFIVRDEKGNVLKERDVPMVKRWSSETPFVYMTPIEHKWGWWIFGGTDYRAVTFGFKKVEFKDDRLYLNGKYVPLKGVNRRREVEEFGSATGKMPVAPGTGGIVELSHDVALLKRFNFNAVHNPCGSDLPAWYDLCDRDGVMVVCDPNAVYGARLLQTFRNHPSLVVRPGRFACNFTDSTEAKGVADGLFDALRNPRSSAFAMKHRNQTVTCEAFDFATGRVRVRNDSVFAALDDNSVFWHSLSADGTTMTNGTFSLGKLKPGESGEFTLDGFGGDVVVFNVFGDRGCMAWNWFGSARRESSNRRIVESSNQSNNRRIDESGKSPTGKMPVAPVAVANLRYSFWRDPTETDRYWKAPQACKIWKNVTVCQKLPDGVKSDLKTSKLTDGSLLVEWKLSVPKSLPPPPRVGLTLTVPKAREVEWFGLGPWENDAERAVDAMLDVHRLPIGRVTGSRTGCRRLSVGEVRIEAVDAPFAFNISSSRDGENSIVHLDSAPPSSSSPSASPIRLSFIVKGLN